MEHRNATYRKEIENRILKGEITPEILHDFNKHYPSLVEYDSEFAQGYLDSLRRKVRSHFYQWCESGKFSKIRTLFDLGGVLFNEEDKKSSLVSFMAQNEGKTEIDVLNCLLSQKADINKPDGRGFDRTPLMWAVVNGDEDAVKQLLSRKVGVDLADRDGKTALMLAVVRGEKNIIKQLLLKKADVHKVDNDGYTVLLEACRRGNYDIAKKILDSLKPSQDAAAEEKAEAQREIEELINKKHENGFTPLQLATDEPSPEMVRLLVARGADVHAKVVGGKTVLHRLKFNLEHNMGRCRDRKEAFRTCLDIIEKAMQSPEERQKKALDYLRSKKKDEEAGAFLREIESKWKERAKNGRGFRAFVRYAYRKEGGHDYADLEKKPNPEKLTVMRAYMATKLNPQKSGRSIWGLTRDI